MAVNLAQRHEALVAVTRREDALPGSMFFASKGTREYLVLKRYPGDVGTNVGARSPEAEARLAAFAAQRASVLTTRRETERTLAEIVAQYRALRLAVRAVA